MLTYTFKVADSIGGRTEQQDAAAAVVTPYGLLVLVCDGMGGTRGGATASRLAIDVIQKSVLNATEPEGATALVNAIRLANREIYSRSQQDDALRGMGTTVTALLLQERYATLAHAGDSRIYQLRKGKVLFRTSDHSKVFELVKRGILSEEQARLSEDSNVILRALGIRPEVEVELNDRHTYQKGDRFLLCTDGISGAISEEQLLDWLAPAEPVETLAPQLIQRVDQVGFREGGGHDNLTAALVECRSASGITEKGPSSIDPFGSGGRLLLILGTALALSLGYLGYTLFIGQPQRKKEQQKLVQEVVSLKRERGLLVAERDSLRRVLHDPLLKEGLRRMARRNRTPNPELPAEGGLVPADTESPIRSEELVPRDSLKKKPRPPRPGALVTPAHVSAPDPL